jgi:hypothetical protein
METRLEPVGEGLWVASAPFSLLGAEVGTRMTVVALPGNGVALISPVAIDDALAGELESLGGVRALIAPNAMHHLFLEEASKRFPEATVFLAGGVEAKLGHRPGGARDLGEAPDALWRDVLEQRFIAGIPMLNEVVFFHPASKSLIVTDLLFHFDPAPSGWTGIFLWLDGAFGCLAVSRLLRFMVKDRVALRAALNAISEWDFERIVVTHGENVGRDAKQRFGQATAGI